MSDEKGFQGLWIPNSIIHRDISWSERALLAEIVILSKDKPCSASNEYLGKVLNIDRRQCIRLIKNLNDKGLIDIVYHNPKNRSLVPRLDSDNLSLVTKCHYDKLTPSLVTNCHRGSDNLSPSVVTKCHCDSDKMSQSSDNLSPKNIENINKNIYKNIGENIAAEYKGPPLVTNCHHEGDEKLAEVIRVYEDNIHPIKSMVEREKLLDLYDHYKSEWVKRAIEEAALSNGRNVKYVSAILDRWDNLGVAKPWEVPRGSRHESRGKERLDKALSMLEEINGHQQRSTDIEDIGNVP